MDIIFFAAVAFFVFLKLNKSLGKIDEEEKKQIEEKIAKKRAEILAIKNQISQQFQGLDVQNFGSNNQADQQIISSLSDSTKQNFLNILSQCKISASFFVNGAKSAFEIIIKAFAEADFETLKFLLSEKIFSGFENSIKQRQLLGQSLTTNIISINKAEIIAANIFENNASITMKFITSQINYVVDRNSQIIEGAKDQINEITDIWTFKKDVNSPSPNWIVCSTSSS